MKKLLTLIIIIIFFSGKSFSQNQSLSDALQIMLNKLDLTYQDIGYKPKSYWTRYPIPNDIPYKILAFDDLMAEPLKTYDFVKTMALSVEKYLKPDFLEKNNTALLKVAYYCGIQHLSSQHRCYNASLFAEIDSSQPMLSAIKEIYKYTRNEWTFNRFGQAADFPKIEHEYKKELSKLDYKLRLAIAPTIIHILNAYKFREMALRNVDYKKAVRIWNIRRLGETQFDGMGYYPEIDDIAKSIDMNSLIYSSYKLSETSQLLVNKLKILLSDRNLNIDELNFDIFTPIGRIIISGTDDNIHNENNVILSIDLGGNDKYIGSAGSTQSIQNGISLLIDLDGDDQYINDDEYMPSQGAAIFGTALLYDENGDDTYYSKRLSQGAGFFGIGILFDNNGDDNYKMWTSGQGAAYFGIGLAIDNTGDDKYEFYGDGQGYGGIGGAGTLINREGNDFYYAEIDPKVVNRMDRDHSKNGEHNYTYCQGSGVGRRGDITDGHSWSGGIGTLIDINGDDIYISGNWSQGCGYWYGMGYLYDGNGNDKYESTSWSMACGAHFCLSGLFDEGGDDKFKIWYEQGVGMGFGHDYTITFFINKGGNDEYQLQENGLGYAINMSQVFAFDTDGNDIYITGNKGHNYGWNNYSKANPPSEKSMFYLYSNQISLFADLTGQDKYINIDIKSGDKSPDDRIQDYSEIFYPTKDEKEKLSNKNYYGLGIDFNQKSKYYFEFLNFKLK